MSNINCVILTGRISSDLNLQYTQQGTAMLGFSLAVSEYSKKDNGEKPSFFSVKAWEHTAQFVAQYGMKGQQVTVSGKLVKNEWTDNKTNQKVSKYEILANNVELGMPPKAATQGNGWQNVNQNPYAPNGVNPPPNPQQYQQYQPQPTNPLTQQYQPQNYQQNQGSSFMPPTDQTAAAMANMGATEIDPTLWSNDPSTPF